MDFKYIFQSLNEILPGILGALALLIIAVIVAWVMKSLMITLLEKINFNQQLKHWGFSKSDEESKLFIETLGSIVYFVIIILFLPSILSGLNVGGVLDPIVRMFSAFLVFVPNLLMAIIILVLGGYFCNFVKQFVKNILSGLNIDKWYKKVTGQISGLNMSEYQMAEVLSSVIYVLIYIPILIVALETLGIKSISEPIIDILNQILGSIPNIFAAVVLIVIGGFVGKLLGDVVEGLLATSGIDKFSKYLNCNGQSQSRISNVIGKIIQGLLSLFFIVEAMSVLRLEVLNTIGSSIINYMPALISGFFILGLGLIGGNIFADFIKQISGSRLFSEIVRYVVIGLAIFMTLEQLQIAQTIVNTSYVMIIGALAGAFILAFGLGGKDLAKMKLNEMNETMTKESLKINQSSKSKPGITSEEAEHSNLDK